MMNKRLSWIKEHKNWSNDDWAKVCFSDESKTEILRESSTFARCRKHEALLPDCITATVKHLTSVMVWGLISVHGPGRLYIVEGMMNQDQYNTVLQKSFLPQLTEWFPQRNYIFMQAGAPCHTAKKVTRFLEDNEVKLLSWPGNSPDLNPIENVWNILKRKVTVMKPTTKRSLTECLLSVWYHKSNIRDMCQKLKEGMKKRVDDVLKNKGGYNKF